MTFPKLENLYDTVEATWPPASRRALGDWQIRDGQGGGSRVSGTTAVGIPTAEDIIQAEQAMHALGQPCLFMIKEGDAALDAMLQDAGYLIKDPVTLYCASVKTLTGEPLPPVTTFQVWPPLQIIRDIWQQGGIGPERLAVMERAPLPKTALLGRVSGAPAGAGFVACNGPVAMVHALETMPSHRRKGLGRHMLRAAAFWATENGARHLALAVTQANLAANALYTGAGMCAVGRYHYRIKSDGGTQK